MKCQPIVRVAVLSTGSVKIHPQHAFGSHWPSVVWLLTSRRWLPPRPINVFVVDHPTGLVLFDSGQDRASITDAEYLPAGMIGWLYRRLARFSMTPQETLTAQLQRLGFEPDRVGTIVLSHLHQDHIGGIRGLPHAEMVVAAREWADLARRGPELRGLLARHIDVPGVRWRRISFTPTRDSSLAPFEASCDLMGDGSLLLLPTPGHTPGSMSLLVRRANGHPVLLVGDLTFAVEALEHGYVPGLGAQRELAESTHRVQQLRARMPGLAILAAHDPGAAERLRQANTAQTETVSA